MIRAVVFDLGQVLSSPPDLFARLAAHVDADEAALAALYPSGRLHYDAGHDPAGYWGPILTGLEIEPDETTISSLAHLDALISASIRNDAAAILRDCAGQGVTVAVLSNAPPAMERAIDDAGWRRHVDRVFLSSAVGIMKPDPAIYRLVTAELGLAPDEIAFIDDKSANTDAAASSGWHTHVWRDDAGMRQWLVGLGVLER